jgi:AcrR family transcriptional regulator
MPYPSQTNHEQIIETAVQLIETEGVEQLTLTRLAAALGIKAPSLYRHLANKDALIQAVVGRTYQQLFAAYESAQAQAAGDAASQLQAILHAHRAFAHAHPQTYLLAFTTTLPQQQADANALEQGALPIQALMSQLSGPADSLPALRGALALAHGFVMLELKGQLRRGGNLTAAFEAAVTAYLNGWQTNPHPPT